MQRGSKSVLVLDADGVFSEYVEPAVARRALKEGVARRVKDPNGGFTVQMQEGLRKLPRLFGRRSSETMATIDKFGKLFEEEQPLWAKTLVQGQVSLEVQIAPGMTMPILLPANGDPVCLTDVADFQSLKRCKDLRILASPRHVNDPRTGRKGLKPPALKILTEPEMREYLEKKAIRRGWTKPDGSPDIERAMAPVYTEEVNPQPKATIDLPASKTAELAEQHGGDANLGDRPVQIMDVVNPRVLSMCHEVSDPDLAENQRMPADQLLDELESLGTLNEESLNHILSYGYYKSVKTWAREQLAERAPGED